MSSVIEIEEAIQRLPADELAKLRQWFADYDAARWDKQFEDDVSKGKLDTLAQEALADLREGRCKEL